MPPRDQYSNLTRWFEAIGGRPPVVRGLAVPEPARERPASIEEERRHPVGDEQIRRR